MGVFVPQNPVLANTGADAPSQAALQSIARQFLDRIGRKIAAPEDQKIKESQRVLNSMLDGEVLIFQTRLSDKYFLEGDIITEKQGDTILASFKDFIDVLYFPITYDASAGTASGWFIRENKFFALDYTNGTVIADGREFKIPASTKEDGSDLMIPIHELASWFGITVDINVTALLMELESKEKLPLESRLARRGKSVLKSNYASKPVLPRVGDEQKMFEPPAADISIGARYRNPPTGDATQVVNTTAQLAGDIAGHSGKLFVTADTEEQLRAVRGTIIKDVEEPELLGPLKARRYEVGDVVNTQIPLIGTSRQELGARVTNKKSGQATTFNTTQFFGDLPAEWDVELYRDNQLIDFLTVEDDGRYEFNDVQLFAGDNNFRLIFYGPQGEVREETRSIPVGLDQLSEDKGTYDVSVTSQFNNLYDKFPSENDTRGDISASATYQRQLTDNVSAIAGYKHRTFEDEEKDVFLTGVSATAGGAFLNSNLGFDVEGEAGLETSVRRRFGRHDIGVSNYVATDGFEPNDDTDNPRTLGFGLNARGPAATIGEREVKYGLRAQYDERADGNELIDINQNFNTRIDKLSVNQSNKYRRRDGADTGIGGTGTTDELLESGLSVSGRYLGLNWRLRGDYQFKPENQLDRGFVSVRKDINDELSTEAELLHNFDPSYTRATLSANWKPDKMIVTPRLIWDSNDDIRATVNTRFGLYQEPRTGEIIRTRERVANAGTISTFVYVDQNGDGQYNEGEPPVPNAKVSTVQVARNVFTNEDGIATLNNIPEYTATDVELDPTTLEDPFWIPAKKGVSVRTRPGHVHEINLPVHIAGEIDGTVYIQRGSQTKTARNLSLYLYDLDGRKVAETTTAFDGFYIFSKVPPGQYYLIPDNDDIKGLRAARPEPQTVTIGYDGTILYGLDITLRGGQADVPFMVVSGFDDYKARHPHLEFPAMEQNSIILNLGQFKSNLKMALTWYEINQLYAPVLAGESMLVPPSESLPGLESNEHTLRVHIQNSNIDDAHRRCRALVARGYECTVELLPAGYTPKAI